MPSSDHASKLHLKETPHDRLRREEKLFRRAARQARKEERRANRASTSASSSSSHAHPPPPPPPRRSASPPPNYQAYHRSQFEQHLRDLASQDEGRASELSSWETGDYGTGLGWGDEPYSSGSSIPKRWASREDNVWNDPLSGGAAGQGGLDEDSYAEEIRSGMYRRKNPESVKRTERLAEEAERTAARLLKMKEEGDKLERERIKKLEARKGERVERRFEEEREAYEKGWKRMLVVGEDEKELRWREIPWPVHRVEVGKEVKVGDMTVPAVREFLMPSKVFWELEEGEGKRRRKEVLRDAIRRYHPDKFSRYLQRVPEKEKEKVQQGVAQVSRVLMELMQAG